MACLATTEKRRRILDGVAGYLAAPVSPEAVRHIQRAGDVGAPRLRQL